jgi:murein DD-endopeptidase MepM/ murein hydrolase activator NlpD
MRWLAAIAILGTLGWTACNRTDPLKPSAIGASTAKPEAPTTGPAFSFPTANHRLLETGGETDFFTPTGPGRPWTGGAFGCVRNSGGRLHEGIDIRCRERDGGGEPIDPVLAARTGMVVHINQNVAASNYGKYVVLRHELEGLPIYTLYAHLRSVRETLSIGARVKAGAPLGILGRTANTREGISKERAHLHFEIGVRVNTRFDQWFDRWYKDGNNFHGSWSGMNLLGLDAAEILKQAATGSFRLIDHLKKQPVLCHVHIHQAEFDWLERFPELVEDIDPENKSAIQAWEVSLNFSGIPIRLKPIREELQTGGTTYRLLEVDAKVRARHPCSGLVFRKGQQWIFTGKGRRAMDLLLFR